MEFCYVKHIFNREGPCIAGNAAGSSASDVRYAYRYAVQPIVGHKVRFTRSKHLIVLACVVVFVTVKKKCGISAAEVAING